MQVFEEFYTPKSARFWLQKLIMDSDYKLTKLYEGTMRRIRPTTHARMHSHTHANANARIDIVC